MSQATELIARQLAAGSANARVWADILYNVKLYGARGDWNGTTGTDDTASVQATIDTAIAAGGKAVFFPHGTYKVTALTGLSSVVLFGDNASFVGISTTINQIGSPTSNLAINVKEYGAKGDGVTDDTTAIQAAINAANAAGGGVVFYPPGTFITGRLNIYSNIVMQGSGMGNTIIKLKNGTNDFLFGQTNTSMSKYGFRDFTADGNSTNNTQGSIEITGNDMFIENCEITNFKAYGIFAFGGSGLTVTNNKIHDNRNVGVLIGNAGFDFTDAKIMGNYISDNDSHGVMVGNGSTATATRVTISNNICNNNGAHDIGGGGIWASAGSSHVTISNNICYMNNGDNIGVAGGNIVVVSANVSSFAEGPTWDKVNSGIAISGGSANVTATANLCFNNRASGIILGGALSNITIADNICYNNSQYVDAPSGYPVGSFHGIQVDSIAPNTGDAYYVNIHGNRCFDDQAVKTQGYGIKLPSTLFESACRNNIVSGNLTGAILNQSVWNSHVSITDNIGFNGTVPVTTPTLATGAGITNVTGVPVRVFITGGTVSAIYIGGTVTGLTGGMFTLMPGEPIQVNYSGGTTWQWIGY